MFRALKDRLTRRQRGYVLITSLIFLMVLTLVAVVATKNTTLQLKMSRNYIRKEIAFEGSEVARMDADNMLDAFIFSRGWPTTQGGAVSATDFGPWPCGSSGSANCNLQVLSPTSTPGSLVNATTTNPPQDLTSSNYATSPYTGTIQNFAPTMLFQYDAAGNSTYTDNNDVNALIYIFRLGVFNNPGSGTAMIAGYEGTGKGAAGAGTAILFYVKSVDMNGGISATPSGSVAWSGADFRDTIRN